MAAQARFKEGERVRVKSGNNPGWNPRTPDYLKGKVGTVSTLQGVIENAMDHRDTYPYLYTVVFEVSELFGGTSKDQVFADVHEDWLEPT